MSLLLPPLTTTNISGRRMRCIPCPNRKTCIILFVTVVIVSIACFQLSTPLLPLLNDSWREVASSTSETIDRNGIDESSTVPIIFPRNESHVGPTIYVKNMFSMHSLICVNEIDIYSGHVIFQDACSADSTGNLLGYIFLAAAYAFQMNKTFQLDCSEPNTVQTVLSSATMNIWFYNPKEITELTQLSQSIDFCQLHNDYPHKYRHGLQYMAPMIRAVLRQAFPYPPPRALSSSGEFSSKDDLNTIFTTPTTNDDDIAIHIRCGDILKYPHHTEYGFPRYEFYRQIIQNHLDSVHSSGSSTVTTAFSIAIVTSPWDPTQCRPDKDCDFIDICRGMITDMKHYFEAQFPVAAVQIYNQDSTPVSYARLIHAKLNICNPSTFCVFPAIAALGESYIVASEDLYPFVEELPTIYDNINVAHVEFLNMNQVNEFRERGQDLVVAITSWARESSDTVIRVNDELDSWMDERSRIEMIEDEFMVLNNVCLTNGEALNDPFMLHFFPVNLDSPETVEEVDLVRLFQDKAVPYDAWEGDLPQGRPFVGTPTACWTNSTLREFLALRQQNLILESSIMNGTTLIAEPHHPDNNFHLHNDLIIPALYKIIKSFSKDLAKKTLILSHGSRKRYENRVVAFDVLLQLFDKVLYPLEEILHEKSDGVMCFERVILGGRFQLPYYSHVGRFGAYDRWKGILPEIRDWVNNMYGIRHELLRPMTSTQPQLTLIDRPCNEYSSRCLSNAADLQRYFSDRFNVSVLSFNMEQNRSQQLISMLQQMASTDILVGMHGAGLAHAVYLQSGTIMVEIKDDNCREKKLFLNMASKQDIGYYLYDALPAKTDGPNTKLSDEEMINFTEDLWRVWEHEQNYLSLQNNSDFLLNNKCLFPVYLSPPERKSILSSFDISRCYLEQYSNEWWQCTHYNGCYFR